METRDGCQDWSICDDDRNRDQLALGLVEEGKSYRQIEREHGIKKD